MTAPLFYEDSLGEKLAEAIRNLPNADDELIDDAEALDEAQREVNAEDPEAVYARVAPDWVPVFGPSKLSGLLDIAGANACVITMPLDAEGIAYVWDPYPPEEMPGVTSPSRALDRPFTLLVSPQDAARARELISSRPGSSMPPGLAASHDRSAEAISPRRELAWSLFVVFLGMDVLAALVWGAYQLYHLLRYHRF